SVDVLDGEHDATDAQRVHRRVHGPKPDRVGCVELVQLNALPIGSPQHREAGRTSLSPISLPTKGPSTVVSPSSLRPSSMKNALAASRSSTTMRTLSIRLSVISFLSSLHCLRPYLAHVAYNDTQDQRQRPRARTPES